MRHDLESTDWVVTTFEIKAWQGFSSNFVDDGKK
jgi:hypothetical protein